MVVEEHELDNAVSDSYIQILPILLNTYSGLFILDRIYFPVDEYTSKYAKLSNLSPGWPFIFIQTFLEVDIRLFSV